MIYSKESASEDNKKTRISSLFSMINNPHKNLPQRVILYDPTIKLEVLWLIYSSFR